MRRIFLGAVRSARLLGAGRTVPCVLFFLQGITCFSCNFQRYGDATPQHKLKSLRLHGNTLECEKKRTLSVLNASGPQTGRDLRPVSAQGQKQRRRRSAGLYELGLPNEAGSGGKEEDARAHATTGPSPARQQSERARGRRRRRAAVGR